MHLHSSTVTRSRSNCQSPTCGSNRFISKLLEFYLIEGKNEMTNYKKNVNMDVQKSDSFTLRQENNPRRVDMPLKSINQ